jgi:hypothetical protein
MVSSTTSVSSGALHAAIVSAVAAHGASLQTRVLDLGPIEDGFGEAVAALATLPAADVVIARKRTATRLLSSVAELVAARVAASDFDGAPCLFVVNGLGRARELDRASTEDGEGSPGPWATLAEILRSGPEVGVHTVVACESLAQLEARLGPEVLVEFGTTAVTAMDAGESFTLIDSPYASTLRPNHALLADEAQGRLIKFRPYVLPPRGWMPPTA